MNDLFTGQTLEQQQRDIPGIKHYKNEKKKRESFEVIVPTCTLRIFSKLDD